MAQSLREKRGTLDEICAEALREHAANLKTGKRRGRRVKRRPRTALLEELLRPW